MNELTPIGKITRPHGIRGDVVVRFDTVDINELDTVYIRNNNHKIVVKQSVKGGTVCHIVGIDSCDDAESLRGQALLIPVSDRPELDDNEFYTTDLVGIGVVENGKTVGKVDKVHNFGANDIIEIRFHDESLEMFAFTHQNFPKITNDHITFVRPNII